MCRRYTLVTGVKELIAIFQLPPEVLVLFEGRYDIAPTQPVLTIHDHTAEHMLWGLIPHWSAEPKPNASLINARAETLTQKPSFRDSFKRRRCIVPATGFYEWQKLKKSKKPFYIQPVSEPIFAFAGLWEEWHGAHGEPIRSCTIITTEANALMATFHDRMPVILHRKITAGGWTIPKIPTR